jgi:hypothetical protein
METHLYLPHTDPARVMIFVPNVEWMLSLSCMRLEIFTEVKILGYPKDGGSMSLWNVSKHISDYKASQYRRIY